MRPGSTTNLSGGALQAIDVLDASAAADAPAAKEAGGEKQGRTRAVMLFTDGLANDGIRETPRLVSAVNGALAAASAKLGGPISLFTFGFGADHNEDCLRSLATGSGAGRQSGGRAPKAIVALVSEKFATSWSLVAFSKVMHAGGASKEAAISSCSTMKRRPSAPSVDCEKTSGPERE